MLHKKILHVIDAVSVAAGLSLAVTGVMDFSSANAAILDGQPLSSQWLQPMLVLLGFVLLTFPLSRRLAYHSMLNPANVAECHEVGQALERIALMQRVQAGNLYALDLDDAALQRAFDGPQGLWTWLRPAYEDPALRRQIHPDLLRRLEQTAH